MNRDEAMIPFKGRLSFKQYMKDKPVKHGIKVFVTVLRKNGLIAGLAKIDFFPEIASTKLGYCLSKI